MKRYALAAIAAATATLLPVVGTSPCKATVLPPEEQAIPTGYAVTSVLVTGSNIATSIANFQSPSTFGSPTWTGYVGVFGGMLGVGLGGAMLVDDDAGDEGTMLGIANILVGSVSMIAGASSLVRAKQPFEIGQAKFDAGPLALRAGVLTRPLPAVGFSARF